MTTKTRSLIVAAGCLLATSSLATAAVPAFEDLTLGDSYATSDTTSSESVAMRYHPFFWWDGTMTSAGYASVVDGGWACGSGNEIWLNNINVTFNYVGSTGPRTDVDFLFGEYGGNINVMINGDFRNVDNFIDLDGQVIGGTTFSVTSGGYGNDCGRVEIDGTVNKLTIGGQELVIDNIVPCQYDYEDLTPGDVYHFPDTFTTLGIDCHVLGFEWADGTLFFNGETTVDNGGQACSYGNELWLNNSTVAHDFAGSVGTLENVSIQFGEHGGNINVDINGDFRNVDNFIDLDGLTVGGVTVSIPYGGTGHDCGKMVLTGNVDVLAIGGQELWIDCLEGDVATAMAGDINNDGSVNVQDLLLLLAEWGNSGANGADLNGDGTVNIQDLLLLLANWN